MLFFPRVNQYKYFMLLCQKCRFQLKDCRSRLTLVLNESSEDKGEMPEAEEKKVNKQGKKRGRRDVCALIWVALEGTEELLSKIFLLCHTV